jgi:hypothetical protein
MRETWVISKTWLVDFSLEHWGCVQKRLEFLCARRSIVFVAISTNGGAVFSGSCRHWLLGVM